MNSSLNIVVVFGVLFKNRDLTAFNVFSSGKRSHEVALRFFLQVLCPDKTKMGDNSVYLPIGQINSFNEPHPSCHENGHVIGTVFHRRRRSQATKCTMCCIYGAKASSFSTFACKND